MIRLQKPNMKEQPEDETTEPHKKGPRDGYTSIPEQVNMKPERRHLQKPCREQETIHTTQDKIEKKKTRSERQATLSGKRGNKTSEFWQLKVEFDSQTMSHDHED
jgi:hypothetical protein